MCLLWSCRGTPFARVRRALSCSADVRVEGSDRVAGLSWALNVVAVASVQTQIWGGEQCAIRNGDSRRLLGRTIEGRCSRSVLGTTDVFTGQGRNTN
jgi:hypothetical protein